MLMLMRSPAGTGGPQLTTSADAQDRFGRDQRGFVATRENFAPLTPC
jgi:hypothetical protein